MRIPLPPLEVQRSLVERVTAARAEIARERQRAARLEAQSKAEIEALILGDGARQSGSQQRATG